MNNNFLKFKISWEQKNTLIQRLLKLSNNVKKSIGYKFKEI